MSGYKMSNEEIKEIWQQMCSEIKPLISDGSYSVFLLNSPLNSIELNNENLATCTFLSPTPFHSQSIKKNLEDKFKEILEKLLGRQVDIKYQIGTPIENKTDDSLSGVLKNYEPHGNKTIKKDSFKDIKQEFFGPKLEQATQKSPRVEDLFSTQNIQANTLDRAKVTASRVGLREDYTFETFAVSSTNEMAHAAATAVSERPGTAYNPLFLYGGVGVGKTHLMHAIGHNIIQKNPETKVIYCTGEEFTNEIINAIRSKKASVFKNKYRNAQVFMIDDIQFIAGKNTVQEEFFHTFNALTQINHQIILTSDRPPHEINLLEARLKSRFEAGLMIDIGQPTFELRTAILLIKSKPMNIPMSMEMAGFIASKVDSARKIEGVLKQIRSAIELKHREFNEELINEILESSKSPEKNEKLRVKPQDLIKVVANHFHVKQVAIRGKSRVKNLVKARHIAMYLFCRELGMPLQETGKWFSGRDHSSVLHARDKIDKDIQLDESLKQDIDALKMSLTAISK